MLARTDSRARALVLLDHQPARSRLPASLQDARWRSSPLPMSSIGNFPLADDLRSP